MCFISMLQIPLFASGCFVIISGFFHALALNGVIPLLIDPYGTLIAAIGMDFSADGFRGCLHCFLVFSLGFLTFCFDEASGLAPSLPSGAEGSPSELSVSSSGGLLFGLVSGFAGSFFRRRISASSASICSLS